MIGRPSLDLGKVMIRLTTESLTSVFPSGGGVRDVSLAISAGEHLVVVGPSGAGKTTLLRLIAGLQRPDRGRIRFDDRDVTQAQPHERCVTLIGQRPALYPHLNVRRNLSIGVELRHKRWWRRFQVTPELSKRAEGAAASLGITPLLDRMPQGLSGGEQQRVVIGRAVVSRHPIWLLDEPLAHLDPATRLAVRDELLLLQDLFLPTIIEVTHDPVEARTLGRRVAVLNNGRLEQVGSPAEVYARPTSRSAATSLGWPPMNFIDGSLAAPDAGAPARSFRLRGDGRAVVLGVRAEDLAVGPMPDGAADLGEWLVDRVEEHGIGSLWVLRNDRQLLRRWASPGETAGAKPRVWTAADRCHWFDPADGTRITDWESGNERR